MCLSTDSRIEGISSGVRFYEPMRKKSDTHSRARVEGPLASVANVTIARGLDSHSHWINNNIDYPRADDVIRQPIKFLPRPRFKSVLYKGQHLHATCKPHKSSNLVKTGFNNPFFEEKWTYLGVKVFRAQKVLWHAQKHTHKVSKSINKCVHTHDTPLQSSRTQELVIVI